MKIYQAQFEDVREVMGWFPSIADYPEGELRLENCTYMIKSPH